MLNPTLAILSAILLVLALPRYELTWLAPVALAPLLLACAREPRAGRRFLLGEAAGIIYWFGVCYWIQYVLAFHGGMGEAGGWAVFLLFCLAKALHMAFFALLAGPLLQHWYAIPAIAALWTGIERTHGPLGFAWLALGNAGIDMGIPMRLAPWLGVYGLSFVFAMMGAAVALALLRRPRRHLAWLLALPLLYLLPGLPAAQRATESAVTVQPNIAQRNSWTEEETATLHKRLVYLSLGSALDTSLPPPRMILWPEAPAPLYFYTDPGFRKEAASLARIARTHLLFGTVAYSLSRAPLNSALLLSPDGEPVSRYDKLYLVPFGEFVPPLFDFVNRITNEAGDFEPGKNLVVSPVGDHRIGTFICYESAFPHLVRRFAGEGADVLINLTNDGYFGRTSARVQHLSLARMRAAENGRWLLRPTNDGITVSIDPAGRIVERLDAFSEEAGRLSFSWISERTFYTRFGDWFAWLCLAGGLAATVAAVLPVYRP